MSAALIFALFCRVEQMRIATKLSQNATVAQILFESMEIVNQPVAPSPVNKMKPAIHEQLNVNVNKDIDRNMVLVGIE